MLVANVMSRQNQDLCHLCVTCVQAVKWFAEAGGCSGQWSSGSGPQTINKIQECVIIYQLGRYILQQPSSPASSSPLPVCWYKLSLCGGYISLYKDLSVTLTHLIVCQLFSESLIRKLEYLLNQIWTLWNAVLILFPTPNNEQTMAMVRSYISYS